jgi:hypothetical protein
VCDRWLREGTHIETVLQQLPAAHFDPEFYTTYEKEVSATCHKLQQPQTV